MGVTIYLREDSEGQLTHEQVDANFNNLNLGKLDIAAFEDNNTMVARDNDGNIISITIPENSIVGRITGGQVTALTAAQIKTLLAIAIADVSGLTAALADKAAASHTHPQSDIENLEDDLAAISTGLSDLEDATTAALADKADASTLTTAIGYFDGMRTVLHGTATLVDGTVTVALAAIQGTDKVILAAQTGGANSGALYPTINEGVNLVITSTNPADTAVVYYEIRRAI